MVDYEEEILRYIRKKSDGVILTDISNGTGFSRNTVSKYLTVLELKKKIISKKLGIYKLYFCADEGSFSKLYNILYYKGILLGLKKMFPKSKEAFKKIGFICGEFIESSLGSRFPEKLKGFKYNRLFKTYFQIFGKFYTSYNIMQPNMESYIVKTDKNRFKSILKISNSEFLQDNDDFIYHLYIIAGMIEAVLKKEIGLSIKCDVETINISNDKKDSFYEISIQPDIHKNIQNQNKDITGVKIKEDH